MRYQAVFSVEVDGTDITARIADILQSIIVEDRAGASADQATIIIDDSAGNLIFPRANALCKISLGFRGQGIAPVFEGKVDEVRSKGGRAGKTIHITAKGIDTAGKAKQPQNRHFDEMSVLDIMRTAGQAAGITDIRIDPDLAGIIREYEHMDNESFIAFGERLAREIGGTFKIRNDAAVMALKNGGRTPTGGAMPVILAEYGVNLHSWDVAPYIGRSRYQAVVVRYYDQDEAEWNEVEVETGVEGSDAIATGRFEATSREAALTKANEMKAQSQKKSGGGKIEIEGQVTAVPEASCLIAGARGGVDGLYKIDVVRHQYSRSGGFVTSLTVTYPS